MHKQNNPITYTRITLLLACVILLSVAFLLQLFRSTNEVLQTTAQTGLQQVTEQDPVLTVQPIQPSTTEQLQEIAEEPIPIPTIDILPSINGYVVDYDTGEPVAGIKVQCNLASQSQSQVEGEIQSLIFETDENGAFHFDNLMNSLYRLIIAEDGWMYTKRLPVWIDLKEDKERSTVLVVTKGGILSGRVYCEDTGEGIENAQIEISHVGGSSRIDSQVTYPLTDSNGNYHVGQLISGVYKVSVYSDRVPGFPPDIELEQIISIEEGQLVQGVDFVLQRGLQLSGQVVAEDDNLEGITIIPKIDNQNWTHYICDKDGRFTISGLTAGNSVVLSANPAPKSNQLRTVTDPFHIGSSSLEGVEIKMDMGGSISGVVVDRLGKPIAKASVYFESDSNVRSYAECNADGRFVIYGLEPKKYTVAVSISFLSRGPGLDRVAVMENVWPERDETIEGLRLVCEVAADKRISGRVTYNSGAPASGIVLSAERDQSWNSIGSNGGIYASGTTNAYGYYEISGLWNYPHFVYAEHNDELIRFAAGLFVSAQAGDSNVDIVLPDPREEITLSINGQVLSAHSGKPIPLFEIKAEYTELNGFGYFKIDNYFDKEGRFTHKISSSASKISVSASAKGFTSAKQTIAGPWSGDAIEELTFTLETAPVPATLTGRVTDSKGEAILGAKVLYENSSGIASSSHWNEKQYLTDLEGYFEYETQTPQPVELWISHPDYPPVKIEGYTSTNSTPAINITLPEFGILEGHVFNDGKPVKGADIKVKMDLPEKLINLVSYQKTDENGRYQMKSLVPMTVRVMAIGQSREGYSIYETQSVTIEPGNISNLDFDLSNAPPLPSGAIRFD